MNYGPAPVTRLLHFALFAAGLRLAAAEQIVLLVAGQSNVLNWHADAAMLPSHSADTAIAFFFHTGAPPSKAGGMSTPFNATSAGVWTTLRPQRQEPYLRYFHDFFGPEISLARTLHDGGVRPLGLIKVGYFGSSLADDWHPTASAGNLLYALLLEQVRSALRQSSADRTPSRLAGFYWLQGETDATRLDAALAYEVNLRALIAHLRQDLAAVTGADPLPVLIARIGPLPARVYPYQHHVRGAQVRVAESTPGVAWVDTDDLPRDEDGIHLLAPGVLALGKRWAAAWVRLQGGPGNSAGDAGGDGRGPQRNRQRTTPN